MKLCLVCNAPIPYGLFCSKCRNNNEKQTPTTYVKPDLNLSTKDFYLQLETNTLINTKNYMGFNIRRIRKLKKLSYIKIAKNTSLNGYYLSRVELGEKKISLDQFIELVNVFEVNPMMFGIENDDSFEKLYDKFGKEVIDIGFII